MRASQAIAFIVFMAASYSGLSAGSSVPSRVVTSVDNSDRVTLAGGTHPLAAPEADQGLADPGTQIRHMYIALQRSAEQERALEALHARQYDAASADYHRWLQPTEFGLTFGPNDADIAAVTSWLKSAGLQVLHVSDGRVLVDFSGTAAQVQRAFGVQMHRYQINGVSQIANDRNPQIPSALQPVIAAVSGLNDIPMLTDAEARSPSPAFGSTTAPAAGVKPDLTVTGNAVVSNFVTPYDFATIYNSLPLWNASTPITGTGVTIAIVGGYDFTPADVSTFRSTFGLPKTTAANAPSFVNVGTDPKTTSVQDTVEVEMASGAAPGAKVVLYVPDGGGVALSNFLNAAEYVVDKNVAPIMVASLSECELNLGSSNGTINELWGQAVLQGISIFVAAGGQGAAACSSGAIGAADKSGLQVNGVASSPYVTAVGGTDFATGWLPFKASTYWNSTGSTDGNTAQLASAKGYVPEMPWNVSCANWLVTEQYFITSSGAPKWPNPQDTCNAYDNSGSFYVLLTSGGGGGGISHCSTLNSNGTCASGYAQPSWQTSAAPSANARAVPDVSLFASRGFPLEPGTGSPGSTGVSAVPPSWVLPSSAMVICYSGPRQWVSGAKTYTTSQPCFTDQSQLTYNEIAWQTSGGTAAASAYWAGILAMVEQKHGQRLGLINKTLYQLWGKESLSGCNSVTVAAGNSCVFYDIANFTDLSASLSNAQPCIYGSSTDCGGSSLDYGILNGYNAATGYDEATGLGSVNITNLVNNWPTASATPAVSLSATSLSFGSTAVGATSAAQSITVKNSGTVAVTFTSGGITLSGESDDFVLSNGCTTGLAVGGQCMINLSFKPVSTGGKSATLSIADSASGSPQTVTFTGTGVMSSGSTPAVTLSTTSLTFASTAAGSKSAAQALKITNSGSGALTLSSIALSGAESDDFALTNGCGTSLAATANCTLSITFAPVSAGSKSASLTITDNASGAPQLVTLSGTGVAASMTPVVSLSATSLTFSSTAAGAKSAVQTLTLSNTGKAALTLTSIALSGGESDDFTLSNPCGTSIPASGSCTFSVTFNPVSAGTKTASIKVTDNATGSPQSISLSGTGT